MVSEEQAVTSHAEDAASMRTLYLKRMRNVPGAVAIIGTALKGVRGGLAATAWSSLSADPPSMLVCVNQSASAHDMIVGSGVFTINQLASSHDETVAIFSNRRGLQGDNRFLADEWMTGSTGAPVLTSAVTAFECRVVKHVIHETHSIFIGQVEAIFVHDADCDPVSYFDGALCMIARPTLGGV